ncbi:hypothetical protein VCR4J5_230008 [Vibrio crassostreae]|uniref:Uncharacterized protein n=1 Tax=Vibrio crassostreae TaxID=246167 RepID=A0ABP1WWX7_9VIBR|nr:hypothetical protein VCR19J5_1020008 [Vibrio crassostreae]CDT00391.1 hypothetical protein VCR15J5_120008 [Vibrio crassostreae]CDT02005.1 hypothetical protein VCR9J2_130086 [Vibrio crassostreae]CDT15957.1 hypothetical protein VCR20J5_130087 [Vibrio crassostreae]CDT39270.1 hypothetical protein VCR4J5_230008 [Vibrio crassostreae]
MCVSTTFIDRDLTDAYFWHSSNDYWYLGGDAPLARYSRRARALTRIQQANSDTTTFRHYPQIFLGFPA